MKDKNQTRRDFLRDVAVRGPVAALGGLVSIGLSKDIMAKEPVSMTEIDPEMILYKEIIKPAATGFTESHSISADGAGLIYLAGDRGIKVMDYAGAIRETIDLDVSPYCLIPREKMYYIALKERIIITDRNGKRESEWPLPGDNSWITAIAMDDEHMFIADAGQRIVLCYDLKGNFIRRIGDKNFDRDIPGFVVLGPYFDLAIAPDGLLRVANPGRHRVEAYTVKGDLEFAWGEFGNRPEDFTACCNPVSFAVLSDGSIITCEKGIARVKVYDTFGKLRGFVADPKDMANVSQPDGFKIERTQRYGFDIAADDNGHVFILDRSRNLVRFFKRK